MGVIINGGMNIGSGRILISSPYIIPFDYTGPICVSGASLVPQVNGTYTFNGYQTVNGYTRPNYIYYYTQFQPYLIENTWFSGRYQIREGFGDSNNLYEGNTFPPPLNPYLETSWSVAGFGPEPSDVVVTIGPC
jgi:hypothetical protein